MVSSESAIAPGRQEPGLAIVQVDGGKRWLQFRDPIRVVQTYDAQDVQIRLREVADAVEQQRLHAAGFITYEAAPAFDPALPGRPPGDLPLLWFGLYRDAKEVQPEALFPPVDDGAGATALHWQPGISRDAYDGAIDAIKEAIARGDTYQVNFTFPLHAIFSGDPRALFGRMLRAQRCQYAAYVDTGRHVVCSASPELFFELDGARLSSRPMKGTAARGRTLAEDDAQRQWLRDSAKNRAENVMIVDMVRNDMGRIARYGTVHVPALFEVERYPTVWQMTSIVACETDAAITEIMAALFPCASITGAPKVRTMTIIADLEAQPRGLYTGCIGVMAPGRRAQFNVAIRTVVIDLATESATYGVGGGVIWDSQTDAEYEEALLKAQVLTRRRPAFELLETLRWTPEEGYSLLDRHLQRLAASAEYFDVPLDVAGVADQLGAQATTFADVPQRVRILVAQSGAVRCEASPLTWSPTNDPSLGRSPDRAPRVHLPDQAVSTPYESGNDARVLHVGLARTPVDASDPFLFHKTTHRAVYEQARQERPDCDDVLLWNERGELTESTIANIVIVQDGDWVTPPVGCGLLGGTLRAELLDQGRIREAPVHVTDLELSQQLWLINSVRGWVEARLAD